MKDIDKIDHDYLKAFNDGYLIARYEPELAHKLSKIKAVSTRIIGIQQGREQFVQEQLQEKLPSWLKENPIKINKKKPDKEKGRDFIKE